MPGGTSFRNVIYRESRESLYDVDIRRDLRSTLWHFFFLLKKKCVLYSTAVRSCAACVHGCAGSCSPFLSFFVSLAVFSHGTVSCLILSCFLFTFNNLSERKCCFLFLFLSLLLFLCPFLFEDLETCNCHAVCAGTSAMNSYFAPTVAIFFEPPDHT